MKPKYFLIIIAITFIVIIIWVTADIIHSQQKSQIAPDIQSILEPVNPKLDQELINEL